MKYKNCTYSEILISEVALLQLCSVDKELVQRNAQLFLLLLGVGGIAVCSAAIRIGFQVLFWQSLGIKITQISNEQEEMNCVDQ